MYGTAKVMDENHSNFFEEGGIAIQLGDVNEGDVPGRHDGGHSRAVETTAAGAGSAAAVAHAAEASWRGRAGRKQRLI